jgi:hypothetical protein
LILSWSGITPTGATANTKEAELKYLKEAVLAVALLCALLNSSGWAQDPTAQQAKPDSPPMQAEPGEDGDEAEVVSVDAEAEFVGGNFAFMGGQLPVCKTVADALRITDGRMSNERLEAQFERFVKQKRCWMIGEIPARAERFIALRVIEPSAHCVTEISYPRNKQNSRRTRPDLLKAFAAVKVHGIIFAAACR